MKTTTNIRTEYAVLALKPDGKWKTIAKAATPADADKLLKEHLYDVERYPALYNRYEAYRIGKRTVITITEDWQEVEV